MRRIINDKIEKKKPIYYGQTLVNSRRKSILKELLLRRKSHDCQPLQCTACLLKVAQNKNLIKG